MVKLFGKYGFDGVEIRDKSLKQVISLQEIYLPHSFGRHAKKPLAKEKVNIVERLVNKLMRGGTGKKTSGKVIRTNGRLQGKKTRIITVVKEAFGIIEQKTKKNPIQVLVEALENSAPREEVTRVSHGGVSYQIAVDSSASRRLDLALKNITLSALMRTFNKDTSLGKALADEIMFTAGNDVQNSYAIKKMNEMERMARSAR
ncbi:30S ribosomal protein S7 [Candidatus Micrarchaeota archaeon]|nr:30S ribosomal protein S7 [Candidatus Micrarchaeota archaeon]